MKTLKYFFLFCLLFELVSCGVYKRNSTETDLKQNVVEQQKKQNNKVILEILESTLDYYGADSTTVFNPTKAQPKQWTLNTTKTTKSVDKGTLEKNIESATDLKQDTKNKENPWRPPWYLSGLIVLVLLVAYKVFKTKFQIVKRI
jgi:hypothetical protein